MSRNPPGSKRKKTNNELLGNIVIAVAAVIAAIITGVFTWFAATANWQQKARDGGWIPKEDCLRVAKESGWIPKSECRCNWKVYSGHGTDDTGTHSVGVRINILSQEYRWQYGQVGELVEFGGQTESVRPHLSSLDVSQSKAIVCLGAASVEGGRTEQKDLALARAKKLKDLVGEQLTPQASILTLNLGRAKYGEVDLKDPLKNASQRRVIVVEVIDMDEGVNLKQALFNALLQARNSDTPVPFDVRDYFDFDLDPPRINPR